MEESIKIGWITKKKNGIRALEIEISSLKRTVSKKNLGLRDNRWEIKGG
jgi:hypothetical protein